MDRRNSDALVSLREAFEKGYPWQEAQADPELNELRKDPAFQKLIQEFSSRKL
jgi:hypothetical protein